METAKKFLGQHWLIDTQALEAVIDSAELKSSDTVLEIGPGLGHLTSYLLPQVSHVVAVELDERLVEKLSRKFSDQNFTVHNQNILKFDLTQLPDNYKVVANIPYYLTSNLLRALSESLNPPKMMVLLVQKEVAERIAAKVGQMSLLSISVQMYYSVELGTVIPAELFEPPPKVDSQIVTLHQHIEPLFSELDSDKFFRVVKAGFSERRKKLRSSLAGGLQISKEEVEQNLKKAGIDSDLRAQNLSLNDWYQLYQQF